MPSLDLNECDYTTDISMSTQNAIDRSFCILSVGKIVHANKIMHINSRFREIDDDDYDTDDDKKTKKETNITHYYSRMIGIIAKL